ncbi:MAG: ATP-binding protein, partial [Polyangia bacterium]|nr:ATP-binding protein [Polyangia bacterium]
IGPWGGEGHERGGGMRRGMGRGSGRGEGNGFGRSEGRGPGQGGASGLGRGTWRRGEGGEALALGRAILRLEVEVDDPPIAAAVSRSREVQVVTLSASGVLLLLGLLAFLGQRRAVRMRRRLGEQRRLAEMGELAAVLAHEIRNPLGVIKGYSQLLRERSNGEDAATLDRLVGETGRLERLVNGLLDFARPTPPKIQEVDLVELCTRACELASDEAQRREVRFVLDLEPVRLAADPDMLLQALLNLIRNAVQASRAGEAVTVRCLRQGSSASITVLDAGPGLPEGLGEDIFKPFVTTRAGGTGLGLAVSRRIAEEHGGELTASPGEERGAMFRLRLPIGRASQEGA